MTARTFVDRVLRRYAAMATAGGAAPEAPSHEG